VLLHRASAPRVTGGIRHSEWHLTSHSGRPAARPKKRAPAPIACGAGEALLRSIPMDVIPRLRRPTMPSSECVTVHFKSLVPLTNPIQQFIDTQFASMRDLFAGASVTVHLGTIEDLSAWSWQLLDNNPATQEIVADGGNLYQRHNTGLIWRYTGPPLTGWELLDNNPATAGIAASGGNLYQRHNTGLIWRYTGPPLTGWEQLDDNPAVATIVSGGGTV
jgi:hypothetical protein